MAHGIEEGKYNVIEVFIINHSEYFIGSIGVACCSVYTVPVLVQFGYCIHVLQKLSDLEHKLKEADANLLSRDRLISELRLRMPATAERDAAVAKATANAQ